MDIKIEKEESKLITFKYQNKDHYYSKTFTVDKDTDVNKLEKEFTEKVEKYVKKENEYRDAIEVIRKRKPRMFDFGIFSDASLLKNRFFPDFTWSSGSITPLRFLT